MMTFKNPAHVSVNPKVWTAPNGRRIEWRSDRQPFDVFMATLTEYYAANNLGVPDQAIVQDTFCRQMPKWVCAGTGYHTSQSFGATPPEWKPCGTCGKKR